MTAPQPRLADLDNRAVARAYRRWAPVYDATFGRIVEAGLKQAAAAANKHRGLVLEVGVGTGLSLPMYRRDLTVTGVDLSPEMLARARERVVRRKLSHIADLRQMDASALDFPDAHFDVATAMFVLTVVPDPAAVMHELARVTRPGGEVITVNHFSIDKGVRGAVEKRLAGLSEFLGWRPEFPVETLLVSDRLALVERRPLKPFGLFTLLRFARLP